MVFSKRLRAGVRSGRIRCSVRFWLHAHVKAGGSYPMEEGRIVVTSIDRIRRKDITSDLAKESGFESVNDLLETARHGPGENIYLVRFRYLPPGAWHTPAVAATGAGAEKNTASTLLGRIRAVPRRKTKS